MRALDRKPLGVVGVELLDLIDIRRCVLARGLDRRQQRGPIDLAMREQLLALAGSDYPRIREAAIPLTAPGTPRNFTKLAIDILVLGIESGAPKRRRGQAR